MASPSQKLAEALWVLKHSQAQQHGVIESGDLKVDW